MTDLLWSLALWGTYFTMFAALRAFGFWLAKACSKSTNFFAERLAGAGRGLPSLCSLNMTLVPLAATVAMVVKHVEIPLITHAIGIACALAWAPTAWKDAKEYIQSALR